MSEDTDRPSSSPQAIGDVTGRHLRSPDRASRQRWDVDRWAIIVGISKYRHAKWNLKYAHQDAEELAKLLQTPSGGGFEAARIKKLVDAEATTREIRKALRDFLKKPAREDLVLLFFACHGAPDPDRPGNVYLLTHDTEPDSIAGTALPMNAIHDALRDTLLSERVVLLADTCHSAAIGGETRSTTDLPTEINNYLQGLSKTKPGIALLTSAAASEVSQEGSRWKPGHGVFTYYLLEGMRGKADTKRDGTVTVGELFEYVRENVRRATKDKQHPHMGADFDRDMPMAITGGIAAREHLELGCRLAEMGRRLEDPGRLWSAVRHFAQAIELSGDALPIAWVERGRAEMTLGKLDHAIRAFKAALAHDQIEEDSRPDLDLGIAYARKGDHEQAASALEKHLRQAPADDARAGWICDLLERLSHPADEGRHALLIGIGRYKSHQGMALRGPGNDVELMRGVLVEKYAFRGDDVTILADEGATREGILAALAQLRERVSPRDLVLIYYSGHATDQEETDAFLVPHDFRGFEDWGNSIGAEELHDAIENIDAAQKIAIFDTDANTSFNRLSEDADYAVLMACSPGEHAMEKHMSVSPDVVKLAGAFTWFLTRSLRQEPPPATVEEVIHRVRSDMADERLASPLLLGGRAQPMFSPRAGGDIQAHLSLFEFSRRRSFNSLTAEEIDRLHKDFQSSAAPFPELLYRFGCAYLEKGEYPKALDALSLAVEQRHPEADLALSIARLRTQRYGAAADTLRAYLETEAAAEYRDRMREPLEMLDKLRQGHKRALLVGIDQYGHPDVPNLRGAAHDVRALARVLKERCGFAEVTELLDDQATREGILHQFTALIDQAREQPALFYFAGNGSLGYGDTPMLVTGGRPSLLAVGELAELAGSAANNLVAILDAGWSRGIELPWGASWGTRFVPPELHARRSAQSAGTPRPETGTGPAGTPLLQPASVPGRRQAAREGTRAALAPFTIGRLSIFHVSIQAVSGGAPARGGEAMVEVDRASLPGEGGDTTVHGALTYDLIVSLLESKAERLTYREWLAAVSKKLRWLEPFAVAENLEETLNEEVFGNPVMEARVQDHLDREILRDPIRKTVPLLRQAIEQLGGNDPQSHLDLGVAYAALGEVEASIQALNQTIKLQKDVDFPEARYHLGRVLYENGRDLDQAVSMLRQAVARHHPNNVAAHYYLGQAIRAQVDKKALVEAEEALNDYLEKGAPLGKEEEVRRVLESMRSRSGTGTGSGAGTGSGTGYG